MTGSSRGQEVRERAEKKERDPESVNRSKRRRSERSVRRNERDSSDESMGDDDDVKHRYQRKSLPFADGMIGVPVPRKARSGSILFIIIIFFFFCLSDFQTLFLHFLFN